MHEILNFKIVKFCFIPSHIGIKGNEIVDKLAKESFNLEPVSIQLPSSDLKSSINQYQKTKWLTNWNEATFNKLHDINPSLEKPPTLSITNRRDQVVISRCRIGHTRLTHSYLLNREQAPLCIPCDEPLLLNIFCSNAMS